MLSHTAWLASYPKSGNTWVRTLLHTLEAGSELDLNRLDFGRASETMDQCLGAPLSDTTDREALTLLRLSWAMATPTHGDFIRRKTHQAWLASVDDHSDRWQPQGARAIYLLRDPRAVAVSWAHHLGCSHSQAVDVMADAQDQMKPFHLAHEGYRTSTWSAHVTSWTRLCELPVLTIRYEDLLTEPVAELTAMADFLQIPHTPERIEQAVDACTFTMLAAREITEGFTEAASHGRVFFRRGEAEAWREELDPALVHRIEGDHHDVMREFGYLTDSE